jgi:hypothetical protein
MQRSFFWILIFISAKCFGQINVVPMPAEVNMGKGKFILNSKTIISLGHSPIYEEVYANYLNKIIQEKYGYKLKIIRNKFHSS